MDKHEYNLKLEEIEKLAGQGEFAEAAKIADGIDWRRVRNIRTLCMVSEIYEETGRLEESRNILVRASKRAPLGRSILYRLVELSIKMKEFDVAVEYYTEYVQAAPNDNSKYILKYKIYRGRGASLDEQIQILEEYLDREYTERWAYELANLYQQKGDMQKCLTTCDDLVLWFHSGKYVIKALELKRRYAQLTPKQQDIYNHRFEMDDESEVVEETVIRDPLDRAKEEEKELQEKAKQIAPEFMEEGKTVKEVVADSIVAETEKKIAQEVSRQKAEQDQQAAQSQEVMAQSQLNKFDTRELQEELAKSMRSIISGMARHEDVSSEGLGAEYMTPAAVAGETTPRTDGQSWNEPYQGEQLEGQMSIDDVLLSMSEEEKQEQPAQKEQIRPDVLRREVEEPSDAPTRGDAIRRAKLARQEDEESAVAAALESQQPVQEEPESPEAPEEPRGPRADELQGADTPLDEEADALDEPDEEYEGDLDAEEPEEPEVSADKTIDLSRDAARVARRRAMDIPQPKEEKAAPREAAPEKAAQPPKREQAARGSRQEKAAQPPKQERAAQPHRQEKPAPQAAREEASGMRLRPDQRNLFAYFADIPGMEEQIATAIAQAVAKDGDRTSKTGNVLIFGAHGSGKTTLAMNLAKAIFKERGIEVVKMAKIYSSDLNRKDIPSTIARIAGGILIVEEAGDLEDRIVDQLTTAMEFRTDGLIVVLEDEQRYVHELLMRHPRFTMKFTSQIFIPPFGVNDLLHFGEIYAAENGYVLDESAEEVLYERICAVQNQGNPVSISNVKEIVDGGISKAEKLLRKMSRSMRKKRFDQDDYVVLYDKDFKFK